MKKLIAILLTLMLLAGLAGCGIDYAAKLQGTWACRIRIDDDFKEELLDNIELYDEEKALVNTTAYESKHLSFNANGTYSFQLDKDTTVDYLRDFYRSMFKDLYEGRATLTDCYDVDLSGYTEEEFYAFYAGVYDFDTIDEVIENMAVNSLADSTFAIYEMGTFKATGTSISFDSNEDEDDGNVKYKLDGSILTITYSDGTETYYKVN